ncbi:hypothetical protein [Streptomyces erythrochromogenes]|uniref:hypothetical protein n=1 Tax=Streptomyces erythrochromogenes TaxID=285574 RepID=UPI0004CD4C1C|nr:hypothetical protein [Streptomyces erythrochromogenes]
MTDINARGPAPVGGRPAKLTLAYNDKGQPVLTATEGTSIPTPIPVVNAQGNVVAHLTAAPATPENRVVFYAGNINIMLGPSERPS